jgi:hypothetical protein
VVENTDFVYSIMHGSTKFDENRLCLQFPTWETEFDETTLRKLKQLLQLQLDVSSCELPPTLSICLLIAIGAPTTFWRILATLTGSRNILESKKTTIASTPVPMRREQTGSVGASRHVRFQRRAVLSSTRRLGQHFLMTRKKVGRRP